MAGIPEFKQDEDVFTPVNVNSRARGFEQYAQAFGQAAKFGEEQAVKIETEKSNAQLMTAASSLNDLTTKTQMGYIQNPQLAKQVYQEATDTAETIKKSAYVNKEDRLRLEEMTNHSLNGLQLKAAEINDQQTKLVLNYQYGDKAGGLIAQLKYAVDKKDYKQAEILQKIIHENALAAAKAQVISPAQLEGIAQATMLAHLQSEELHKLAMDEHATAEQLHIASQSIFRGGNPLSDPQLPIDGNTHFLVTEANRSQTFEDQIKNLYTNRPVNLMRVADATTNERYKFDQAQQGVNRINGMVSAGTPYTTIDHMVKALELRGGNGNQDQAQIARWKAIKEDLITGNGTYQFARLSEYGRQLAVQHDAQNAALRTSYSGDELAQKLNESDQQYALDNLHYMRSIHMDPHYVQPLAAPWVSNLQLGMEKGNSPDITLQQLAALRPELRPYSSNVMKYNYQGVATWIAGAGIGRADPSFQRDWLAAQQSISGKAINEDTAESQGAATPKIIGATKNQGNRNQDIWSDFAALNTDNKKLVAYLALTPDSEKVINGFQTAVTNYVTYKGMLNNDASLDNKAQYINELSNNLSKSFKLYKSSRGILNLNMLNIPSEAMADKLNNYALIEAHRELVKSQFPGELLHSLVTRVHKELGIPTGTLASDPSTDLSMLQVVSTPDNRIIVVTQDGRKATDATGRVLFERDYTPQMLSAAVHYHRTLEDKKYLDQYDYFEGVKGRINMLTHPSEKNIESLLGS